MIIHGLHVRGEVIDSQTRCKHYHKKKDIVAIKFKCCNTYYPCFKCHNETVDHPAERWKHDEFIEKAILCGACGTELTIDEYIKDQSACSKCASLFNPYCETHSHLYFEV